MEAEYIACFEATLDDSREDSAIFERNFKLHAMLPREKEFAIDRLL